MRNSWRNKGGNVKIRKLKLGRVPFQLSNFILAILLAVACTNQSKDSAHRRDQYTCPMHPQIVQDKPGTCPVCGMELVLKGRTEEEVKITKELSNLLKPTDAAIVSSIRTVMPVEKKLTLPTSAKGIITYDTRRAITLPIRYGGRIEKLYLKYNYQPVRKGQKVLEIYSPELVTAQREFIYLLESDPGNSLLINGAKQRLYLLGISETQVAELAASRKESYSFPVLSPIEGYVAEEATLKIIDATSALPSQTTGMGNGMGTANNTEAFVQTRIASTEFQIREGTYVTAGETLFKVVNTSQVWAEFAIYHKDAANIQLNDPLEISFDNMGYENVQAKVNFIQPFFKAGENFVKLRVYLTNVNGKYEIGQLITARFNINSKSGIWIPTSSVLDLGTQKIVFVKRRGVFRPRSVDTGRQSKDWTELLNGIDSGDSIAYQAQFMVDSESFIKVSKRN